MHEPDNDTPAPGVDLPRFAVVGHPNKGKSSVVATLAQNDSIAIAMEPGTTRDSHRYPMKVDDVTLYELIDTPGFQRPARCWPGCRATACPPRIGRRPWPLS